MLLAQEETPQGSDGGKKDLPSLWQWLQTVGRNHRVLEEVVPMQGPVALVCDGGLLPPIMVGEKLYPT